VRNADRENCVKQDQQEALVKALQKHLLGR
jgi:hypothetical protein